MPVICSWTIIYIRIILHRCYHLFRCLWVFWNVISSGRSAWQKLRSRLKGSGLKCEGLHGEKSQREREEALRLFKAGAAPVLPAAWRVEAEEDRARAVPVVRRRHGEGEQPRARRVGLSAVPPRGAHIYSPPQL